MKYLVVAPNRISVQVSISGYHTQEFRHGSQVSDDRLAKTFPNIFIPIPENVSVNNPGNSATVDIKVESKPKTNPSQEIKTDFPEPFLVKQEDEINDGLNDYIEFSKEVNSTPKFKKIKGKK